MYFDPLVVMIERTTQDFATLSGLHLYAVRPGPALPRLPPKIGVTSELCEGRVLAYGLTTSFFNKTTFWSIRRAIPFAGG